MKKIKQKEESYGYLWFVAIGIILILFLAWVSNREDEQSNAAYIPSKVEFCNNTHILFEDEKGNGINGTVWYSQDDTRWALGLPEKFQKDISYSLWIDSPTHFVSPVHFKPECIDENDTRINYIKFNTFKRDNGKWFRINLIDEYDFNREKLTFHLVSKEYFDEETAKAIIRLYPAINGNFMPFGGMMIMEFPQELHVACDQMVEEFIPLSYTFKSRDSRAAVFYLTEEIDQDESPTDIDCEFTFANFNNKPKIDGKNITIQIIPADFYLKQNKELILDITKEKEEIYKFVSNQSVKINGVFEVE